MGALDEVNSVAGASAGRSSVRCLEKARVPDARSRSTFGGNRLRRVEIDETSLRLDPVSILKSAIVGATVWENKT